jgi:hypothetical protein
MSSCNVVYSHGGYVMKNLLALVGAVVVLVGGLGWYLGWYKIGTQAGKDGHTNVTVDVDGNEIRKDLKKGRDTVEGFFDHNSKSVPGTPTSLQPTPPPGGWTLPELPKLPTPPSGADIQRNPDGSLKLDVTIPPPPVFPGNQ